ncbi:MAG: DUF3137 domain-containing protein [Eubacteriales bacterium]
MKDYQMLEKLRLRARNAAIVAIVLIAMGFILFFLLTFIGFLLFVGGIVVFMISAKCFVNPYKTAYKEQLVRGVLAEQIDQLRFVPDDGISEETVRSTDMMQLGNRFYSNDLIEGVYHGVRFTQSDILIQHHTSNGKTSHTTTYLNGRWLVFDFNKRFSCDLQVRDREFAYAKQSGGWFSDRDKTEKLETESVAFNDTFEVYAENSAEAFYILTPHFMEALMRAKEGADGEVLFCNVDSKLHVAVNNERDSFEPSIWQPIDESDARRAILEDLNLITDLIDTLRLDDRLFMDAPIE